MKEMINYDGNKVGTIAYTAQKTYVLYLKDPKKTSPADSVYHKECETVFFGRVV